MIQKGTLLAGQYRLRELLDSGSVADVWEAHDGLRRVAVKLLPPRRSDELAAQRMLREIEIVGGLRGPGTVRLYGWGEFEHRLFMVTELLEGTNLEKKLTAEGPFVNLRTAVGYMLQVCEALQEAHGYKIVHRDIKPANLFLDKRSGCIKVLDFGIAAIASAGGGRLTTPGTRLGHSAYCAPEQLADPLEARPTSDIWSIGVTLFELLVGYVPGALGDGASAVQAVPRLDTLRKDIPPGLASCIARCLERDPRRRFQTVADLRKALKPFAASPPPPLPLPRRESFHSESELVEAIAQARGTAEGAVRKVVFMLGAGVSMPAGRGRGVPGTDGIVRLISEAIPADSKPAFEQRLKQSDNKYQDAFFLLTSTRPPDEANAIIRKAVLHACLLPVVLPPVVRQQEALCRRCEHETAAWAVPAGLEALGRLIAEEQQRCGHADAVDREPRFSKLHLTTNFDPLLSVSIERSGGRAGHCVVESDAGIPELQSTCLIAHLHGRWDRGDTWHTDLTVPRPALVSSLRKHLRSSVLVVIGYGGWRDVFTEALAQAAQGEDDVDILWTFYGSEAQSRAEHAALLEQLRRLNKRITFYFDVDANRLFEALRQRLGQAHAVASKAVPREVRANSPAAPPRGVQVTAPLPPPPRVQAPAPAAPLPDVNTAAPASLHLRSLVPRLTLARSATLGACAVLVVGSARLIAPSAPDASISEAPLQPRPAVAAPLAPAPLYVSPVAALPARPSASPPAPRQRTAGVPARAMLRVQVPSDVIVPGFRIELNGAPLPASKWNRPIPVSVGKHSLEASAPGRKSWPHFGFEIERGQATYEVVIPPLSRRGL